MEEENEAIFNRHAEAINSGDLDTFDGFMVSDLAQEAKPEVATYAGPLGEVRNEGARSLGA